MITIILTPEDVEILHDLGICWEEGCTITGDEIEEIRGILSEIRELSPNGYEGYYAKRLVRG